MRQHVVPAYDYHDRAVVEALEIQCCRACGARLWRRRPGGPEPYMPGIPVGMDCPGAGPGEGATMAKRGKGKSAAKSKPKAVALPGMADRAIKPLEDAAEAYADIRDQRMTLNAAEANLKAEVLRLMHQHGKKIYQHDGITITIVEEEETVKVRVKRASEDDDDDDREDDGAPDRKSAAAGG